MGALGSKPIVIDVKRDKTYYHNTYQIEVKHNPLTGRGYEDFKGFKLYRHELPSGIGYYFENIHHDGKEQNIPNKETFLYNSRGVTVFYWASDLENVLPLIIKYDSDESTFFYKKENIDTNKWSGINYGIIPYLPSDLDTTVKRSFGEVAIPNLSAAKTTTYCAHPSLECFKNPGSCGGSSRHYSGFLTLSVSRSSEPCQGYTKITQQGQYGRPFRILSTYCTFKGSQIQLDKPKLENVTSVSVYYWEGDTAFKNPLILELQCVKGPKHQEFYTRSADGKKWMHASNIDSSKLADDLDVLNCEYNNAVPVDICKRDDGTPYCCKVGCKRASTGFVVGAYNLSDIKDFDLTSQVCTHWRHFGRFKSGSRNITLSGLTLPLGFTSQVIVYFPKCSEKHKDTPILMYISHGVDKTWYGKESLNNENWTKKGLDEILTISPVGPGNKKKIRKALVLKARALGMKEYDGTPEDYDEVKTSTVPETGEGHTQLENRHESTGHGNFAAVHAEHTTTDQKKWSSAEIALVSVGGVAGAVGTVSAIVWYFIQRPL